jgi:UDP-N-acetylmuramyl tripeptide synthase
MRVGGERRAVTRTTPEAIDLQRAFRELLDAGDRSCAMEASSHASELKRLVGTRFRALVFTNLSQDHLDFHGTLEAYYDAKRRLFTEPDVDGGRPPAAVPRSTAATRTAGFSPTSSARAAGSCSPSASPTTRTCARRSSS